MEQIIANVVDFAPGIAIIIIILGIFSYGIALLMATFLSAKPNSVGESLKAWFMSSPAQHIGIPCSAIASFAIVFILLRAFPINKGADDGLMLKAFGLEFSGPSGPITLWLICFLALIFALKLLRTDR